MRALLTCAAIWTLATPSAFAGCWGQETRTDSVYEDHIRVATGRGPATASIEYLVTYSHEVCERTLNAMLASHECGSEPRGQRHFIRKMTVRWSDGRVIELGGADVLVAGAKEVYRRGNCTDLAGPMTSEGRAQQLGTYQSWAQYIEQDQDKIDQDLDALGMKRSTP